ncbi:hypothetical protein Ciccas_005394 [Cichlidogyrus casuarinus]|uniref:Uncharacterized protein n=1 Tax=Cichlidogyrus casuarinus TaxID=1844966 RepID=A0ABD2Q9Q5_9PLAT
MNGKVQCNFATGHGECKSPPPAFPLFYPAQMKCICCCRKHESDVNNPGFDFLMALEDNSQLIAWRNDHIEANFEEFVAYWAFYLLGEEEFKEILYSDEYLESWQQNDPLMWLKETATVIFSPKIQPSLKIVTMRGFYIKPVEDKIPKDQLRLLKENYQQVTHYMRKKSMEEAGPILTSYLEKNWMARETDSEDVKTYRVLLGVKLIANYLHINLEKAILKRNAGF